LEYVIDHSESQLVRAAIIGEILGCLWFLCSLDCPAKVSLASEQRWNHISDAGIEVQCCTRGGNKKPMVARSTWKSLTQTLDMRSNQQ
jgi:hypothetical protein